MNKCSKFDRQRLTGTMARRYLPATRPCARMSSIAATARRRESARASAPLCVRTRRLTGCFINWFGARGAAIYTAADARPALRRDQGLARPATCSNRGIARRENSTLRHQRRRNICALTLRGRGRLGAVSLGRLTRGALRRLRHEVGGPCRGPRRCGLGALRGVRQGPRSAQVLGQNRDSPWRDSNLG